MYKHHLQRGVSLPQKQNNKPVGCALRTIKKRKKGFTLAEVLVTLAVIGVVASLTIPTLMKSHEKQQWITGYKKNYSMISQATRMIMADNGGTLVGAWGADDYAGIYNAYLPYLKVAKKCENQAARGNCFPSTFTSLYNDEGSGWQNPPYSLILTNGACLMFYPVQGTESGKYSAIFIDMNCNKGPNVMGKDIQIIGIKSDNPLVYPGWHDSSEYYINMYCTPDLQHPGGGALVYSGQSCGTRILRGDYAEDY